MKITDKLFLKLFSEIQKITLVTADRCYQIYQYAKYASNLEGDCAEVGVYKGGTAKLISKVCKNKTVHLFDTFEGMPQHDETIDIHKKGEFSDASLNQVKRNLDDCKNIKFYQGIFPGTAKSIETKRFCFVYADADIYQSTRDCIQFFYKRMVPGGILIFDDWEWEKCPGVKNALLEFFADKKESIIKTADYQAIIIKY